MEKSYLSEEYAKRLAKATKEQCAYRFLDKNIQEITDEEIESFPFRESDFYNFFISLPKPTKITGSLLLERHKKPYDMPEKYNQFIEYKFFQPPIKIVTIPRGIIISSKLEEDIRNHKESIKELITENIVTLNKKYAPILTQEKHGNLAYNSRAAFRQLLNDQEIVDILNSYTEKEPYFGFLRVDYMELLPRDNKPGWWKPQPTKLIKSIPIITIPGLSKEHLTAMEIKEKKLLGLD